MSKELDIYVTLSTFAEESSEPLDALKQSGLRFAVNPSGKRITRDELNRDAARASVVVAGVEPYDDSVLAELPALRCISRCGVGIDNIDILAASRRNIAIRNTPDEPIDAVAELAITMIFALLRRLPEVDRLTHERKWKRVTGNLLAGKTVGIVGLGRIGRRVAEMLQPFRVHIIAFDPFLDSDWAAANSVRSVLLDELLRDADIVSLHASGASPLRLGAAEFASMKKGAFLINLARGNMIDDSALVAALDGHLAGAALDTFPEEPYTGPLCDCAKAILFPHQATLTSETRTAMETKSVLNAIEFVRSTLS